MNIHKSAEDYLETILILSQHKPNVRSIDVATELGFSKPSVSVAIKNLRQGGYVKMSDEGYLTLTESGRSIAENIYERHTLFSRILTKLGVDPKIAAEDACRIEHAISQETFNAIKQPVADNPDF